MLRAQSKAKQALLINFSSSKQSSYPNSFSLISEQTSHDLSTLIRILKHHKSGALVYNLINSDVDNCFAPVVKTLPKNNTGCPHILEHLACCGSERYPIRDPFFNMLKRSTNTYMNAWTGEDFTAYPFSSANPKDYSNLYQVYLDLCLKPNLHELDFRQQGWRYEFTTNSQGQQIKQMKGIVLNQMKGAYQNADRQMFVEINNKLFKGNSFQYDSGGKPEEIVKLSYQDILDMHKYYYHPSNASFYYYGNADITSKLQFLQSEYLSKYSNQQQKYKLKLQELNPPQNIYHECISSTAESISLAIVYNMGPLEKLTQVDNFCFNILGYLMCEANPILYQEFIEKGFASSIGQCGFEQSTFCTFKVILKNVQVGEQNSTISEQFHKMFNQILEKICKGGQGCYRIDQDRLQQVIVQSQLNLLVPKQNNGIQLLQNTLPYMNNRLELTNLLNIRSNIKKAVDLMKNPQTRRQFIHRKFIDNQHKVIIKQVPKKLGQEIQEKQIVGLQIPDEVIRKQQQDLKNRQQQKSMNNTDCLPSLKLNDLIALKNISPTILQQHHFAANSKQAHRLIHVKIDKKDINFFRFVFRLPISTVQADNSHIVNILDLWRYSIVKGLALSTPTMTNKQLNQKLKKCSYDFDIKIERDNHRNRVNQGVNIMFSVACLNNTKDQFLRIFREILHESQFKNQDCLNGFKGYITDSVDQLTNMPMKECLQLGTSLINGDNLCHSYNWISNGIKIANDQKVPQQILQVFPKLLKSAQLTIIEHSQQPSQKLFQLINFDPKNVSYKPNKSQQKKGFESSRRSSIVVTHNYDVNFCSQHYPAPPLESKDAALLSLFLQILQQDYLHPKIREKGGAYGARSMIRPSGSVALYSYMDPYAQNTFKAFDQSIKELITNKFSSKQLQQVKIKFLGLIDRPIPPQKECLNMILTGSSIQIRENFRKYIETAEIDEIIEMGKKYLFDTDGLKKRVVFGKQVIAGFEEQKLCIPEGSLEEEQQA